MERVRRFAEVERQRARTGEESGLSARRFTLAESEINAGLAAAEAALARARRWPAPGGPTSPLVVPAAAAVPEPPAAVDPAASPELRAVALEAEQAQLERKRIGRFLGFPTLQFGWQQIDEPAAARSGPIFAAGWTIPLFDRDQGGRIEAAGREEVAGARVELARARVTAEVEGSVAAFRGLSAAMRDAARTSPPTRIA